MATPTQADLAEWWEHLQNLLTLYDQTSETMSLDSPEKVKYVMRVLKKIGELDYDEIIN